MLAIEIIEKKKNGFQLTKNEIDFMVEGYTKGLIPDYQMSAFLMSIYFQGMTNEEDRSITYDSCDGSQHQRLLR